MNTNMNVTIRRLANAFIILFLVISAVAAYVQIANQAFYNGPVLASGTYDQRKCPPYDAPLRGTIYDRNGNWIARTVRDSNAPCGYRREYAGWVADTGLAPLVGYFSYRYGTSGIEGSYNDILAGVQSGETFQNVTAKLLHKARYGNDIYLTIDMKEQEAASNYYDNSAIEGGGVCQAPGSHPPGSLIVEQPTTGEILAMVSKPSYDANKIDDPNHPEYWQQLQNDSGSPLLNHATQGLYDPGSTFKTVTLLAALDTGTISLDTTFTQQQAVYYTINGENINWDDYLQGVWNFSGSPLSFPLTVRDAYALSDNTVFARTAVQLGKDNWLNYARKFGIATPGVNVDPVPFDAPQYQSSAYPATINGKPVDFNNNLLAESGFGQGDLLITPLTMTEISSAVAAGGILYAPHVAWKVIPHGVSASSIIPTQPQIYTGSPIFRPETAQSVRTAMWAVVDHGTAWAGIARNGIYPKDSGVKMGGKTGTGQLGSGQPQTWWISLAPDDQAPGGAPARLNVTVMKEKSGEGACQVWVANDTYQYAFDHNLVPTS
ncbi:MAG TPA: penicillin-binding transpeptidase domain-containing protein [Ktedonobacterales bacterium]|nr:penicillin-binding transpeptidase domain-containing protein [Ktedonobacterales bacterium]